MKRVNALTAKTGPTQSGNSTPIPQPPSNISPVGGEVVPMFGGEILSIIVMALVLVFGFVLIKKTSLLSGLLTRLGL